ncbi:MAG: hypothetical protein JW797_12370 [Bradymonadales bacterium]|nr:hypothetical protein [Bradymonadales bacterium]
MDKSKFKAKIRTSENYSFVRLKGVLDEDNDLAGLLPRLTGSVLIVDAGEVTRISSCGVRDWVGWRQELERRGIKLVLIRCSPSFVTQINLVTNFVGNATVYSFQIPYYCPTCDREKQKLVETASLTEQLPVRAPSFRCTDCGGALEFDDIEESYFAFINSAEAAQPDLRVRLLVEEVAPDVEAKIRALNETGSVSLSGPLQSVTSRTPDSAPHFGPLPPNYLDIEEEITGQFAAVPNTTAEPADLVETDTEPESQSPALMIAFVISAVVVIGLLIYFAITGI